MNPNRHIPRATYRLQFNSAFTFSQAAEIVEYLRDLGISDVYASPLFQAAPGSTHGYDICCFGKLNPRLGNVEDFERFTSRLKELGLGLLLDMVPNHMGAAPSNGWWLDVLENGRESRFAAFFDIDWEPANPASRNKILLPVLEDHYGSVLEQGKLRLTFQDGKFFISYHDAHFPVNPGTLPENIGITENLVTFNGRVGEPRSFDPLDDLIRQQHYRLAHWRIGAEEINYRRFFDVSQLVALKMETPEVFQATHDYVFQLVHAGIVTGLRIDHPDGLWNPKEYFERLHAGILASARSPDTLKREPWPRFYIVAEKILSPGEQLPDDWPVDGTTGYDFLNRLNGVFVNSANAPAFDTLYQDFIGRATDFGSVACQGKKNVLEHSFVSELNALALRLQEIAGHLRHGRDFTFSQLRAALVEVIARFPVYRTYITERSNEVPAADRASIQKAVSDAKRSGDAGVFDFIGRLLSLELNGDLDETGFERARKFVMKFQQLTGPATAKGLEDTAFYNFNRLISLNEVGGEPAQFGVAPAAFDEANRATASHRRHTLLASATHDTKRGEDVRARLNVLSEMPSEWTNAIRRWRQMNGDKKVTVAGISAPDANDEYLLYQSLVGAWPFDAGTPAGLKTFRERIKAFLLKAVREAKTHTSWTEPNPAYEEAITEFIERILVDNAHNLFLNDLRTVQQRIAFFGQFNSLAQTLLKLTSPGVPDFYQGSELWDLNLVDPDNRRPVDFALRRRLLAELYSATDVSRLLEQDHFGRSKLYLIWRALNFRRTHRELFDHGEYVPLPAFGEKREHVCAFARAWDKQAAIVIAPRLVFGLTQGKEIPPMGGDVWTNTVLPLSNARAGDAFRNVLTQEVVKVVEHRGVQSLDLGVVLKIFPVALLEEG